MSKRQSKTQTATLLLRKMISTSKQLSETLDMDYSYIGLKKSSFDVLSCLLQANASYAMTPNQLLEKTDVTSGTLTTRIDKLEKKGWVTRVTNATDKRSKSISLTPQGKEVIEQATAQHKKAIKKLFAAITDDEKTKLAEILDKLKHSARK